MQNECKTILLNCIVIFRIFCRYSVTEPCENEVAAHMQYLPQQLSFKDKVSKIAISVILLKKIHNIKYLNCENKMIKHTCRY